MISIVTITYNNLAGLQKTAQNIIEQTEQSYEWIIIDGDSNDGTKPYLDTLPALHISEPDEGIYDAMNKGLKNATNPYVIFMNAGDQFADQSSLSKLYKAISQENNPDFIYGPALEERLNHEPAFKSARSIKSLIWGMPTHHQAMIYKTDIAQSICYNTDYRIAADYDFTCRFVQKSTHLHLVSFPICLFEAGGISQTAVKQGRQEQFKIRKDLKLCSIITNYSIGAFQTFSIFIKQNLPMIYWFIRSNKRLFRRAE